MPTSQRTTVATHNDLVCCGCAAETDLLQWVEGHRFCMECSSALSEDVWVRVERGVDRRPGSDGPAHSALLDILEEGSWVCEQLPEVAQCIVPPMRLMLVAGFHQHDRPSEWILVTWEGELTVDPLCAQLFAFSAAGSQRRLRRSAAVDRGPGPRLPRRPVRRARPGHGRPGRPRFGGRGAALRT